MDEGAAVSSSRAGLGGNISAVGNQYKQSLVLVRLARFDVARSKHTRRSRGFEPYVQTGPQDGVSPRYTVFPSMGALNCLRRTQCY
jgi:hypothetical protein